MSAAMEVLKAALVDEDKNLEQVKSNTSEAIGLGRRAQAELDSAQRRRDEVAEALDVLRSYERRNQKEVSP